MLIIKRILLIIIILLVLFNIDSKYHKYIDNENKLIIVNEKEKNDWDFLIESLIQIESEGNDDTIRYDTNAAGCLQETPIYVREANRICGLIGVNKIFSLNDRFNREKSIEMFNIVQGYHNPLKNINKAIKLHNPGAKD